MNRRFRGGMAPATCVSSDGLVPHSAGFALFPGSGPVKARAVSQRSGSELPVARTGRKVQSLCRPSSQPARETRVALATGSTTGSTGGAGVVVNVSGSRFSVGESSC